MAIDPFAQNPILAWYLITINVLAFSVYGADKIFAATHSWRVREVTLWTLAILGGSVGALFAMKAFRHKTNKPWFFVPFLVILLLQISLAIFLYRNAQIPGPIMAY